MKEDKEKKKKKKKKDEDVPRGHVGHLAQRVGVGGRIGGGAGRSVQRVLDHLAVRPSTWGGLQHARGVPERNAELACSETQQCPNLDTTMQARQISTTHRAA